MNKRIGIIIGVIVLLIIIIGAAWYAYSTPSIATALGFRKQPSIQSAMAGTMSGHGASGTRMRAGYAMGSIEVLTGNGFTVSLQNGTTKDVTLTATTTIQNYASASSTPTKITADQLSVGESVAVIGAPQSDGSILARVVRTGVFPPVNMGAGRGGNRGRYGQGSTTPPSAQ